MQTISLGEHLPGGANIVLNIDVLNSHHEYIHDGRKYHQDINISFIALEHERDNSLIEFLNNYIIWAAGGVGSCEF